MYTFVGSCSVALPSMPAHYWLSVLLQLSVLWKDCQKALAFAFVCGLAQYGLRGDNLAIWLTWTRSWSLVLGCYRQAQRLILLCWSLTNALTHCCCWEYCCLLVPSAETMTHMTNLKFMPKLKFTRLGCLLQLSLSNTTCCRLPCLFNHQAACEAGY